MPCERHSALCTPLLKKNACLCITLPGIQGLHFAWSKGSKGDEIREVGGCPLMSLPGYLLPVLVADQKEACNPGGFLLPRRPFQEKWAQVLG